MTRGSLQRPLGSAYIALAALAWSLAGLLQRQLHLGLASQLAGRAVFAFLAVFVFVAIAERGQVVRAFRAIGRPGLAIAVLFAISSGSFITALNDTSVANVLVVQALVPLAAALLGMLAGERVHRRTWLAMGIAVAGIAVMAGAPSRPNAPGLFFLSLGTRLIPAATVALISQLENVLGPLWVWLAGIERPSAATIAGGIIVIGAVALTITGERTVAAAGDPLVTSESGGPPEPSAPVPPCRPEPVA